MRSMLAALSIAASLSVNSASAIDSDDLQKLQDTGDCLGCDLRDAELLNADLGGADLTGAYMNGAILCSTIMPDGSVISSGC